ncbi:CDP-alcohol phosphatidyltransferase family protein [Luteococcus sp. Sow4_B9]|uniref:CDP-alcohol phosphatidyltransferase family protein n=1 Tax=Luteococcus sp. Sow4_B9 TaxID=3438792 RepID=UPI003F9D01E6
MSTSAPTGSAPGSSKSFSDSLRQLKNAQKSNKGAPLYSVLVNRPLGRVFAALAHQLGMTPNGVTAVSALFTFTGIGLVATMPPSWPLGIAVGLCLVIGYALDAADGQLARLRGGGSLLGEWLDHVIDSFKIATLHLAVLVMAFRHFGSERWLLVPLGFAAVYVIHFFGMLLTDLLARVHHAKRGQAMPAKGIPSMLLSVAKLPTDYGFLAVIFFTLGAPVVFQWLYTFMFVCTAGYTALVLPRWARGISALDREAALEQKPGQP